MTGLRRKIKHIFVLYFLILFTLMIFGTSVSAKNADGLYRKGQYAEAEKEYQKLDADNPKDIRYRYDRGCAAYQNKDYQAAEAAFGSVLRRTKDRDMLFRTAYNLGNTAFVQNDYAAAVEYYKQAIIYNPGNSDAKHNLELSLKKLEDAKKNPDKKNDKNGGKNDGQNGNGGKSDSGNEKSGKEKDKSGNGKENDKDNLKKKNEPKDLTGNLSAANPMDEKKKNEQLSPEAMMERKKAEALLDNVKENRAALMQMRKPGQKDAASGKNW